MKRNEILEEKKKKLLNSLIVNDLLKDKRLVKAFYEVPLEEFIPKTYLDHDRIYRDAPNLFYYQNRDNYRTISAPHMITIMLQGLALKEDDDLLILGAKSGYIAALAHKLAPKGEIFILEADVEVAKLTKSNLEKLKLQDNINVIVKNPLLGMLELSPWNKILVTGAITQERIKTLLSQLNPEDGVLYAPIGGEELQIYTQILRVNDEYFGKRQLQVKFTPLITQLQFDELELITDFEEVEIKDDPQKVEQKLEMENDISNFNINIKYSKDILTELGLNQSPRMKMVSKEVRDKAVDLLESILTSILSLKTQEDIDKIFSTIDHLDKTSKELKTIQNIFNFKLKKIRLWINQIRAHSVIRRELEKKKRLSSDTIDKKLEIINKILQDLTEFEDYVEEQLNYIKNL